MRNNKFYYRVQGYDQPFTTKKEAFRQACNLGAASRAACERLGRPFTGILVTQHIRKEVNSMTPIKEKAAWTPGPWQYLAGAICVADKEIVARIEFPYADSKSYQFNPMREANARLIAKAPEMAEKLLDLLERFKIVCPDVDGVTAEWDQQRIERIERLLKEAGAL